MWFLRNSNDTQQPEVLHIARPLDKDWVQQQIICELVRQGLIQPENDAQQKRADMELLHSLRLSWEAICQTMLTTLTRSLILGIIALIGWGIVYYIKITSLPGLSG
jgi:hypothetical protein